MASVLVLPPFLGELVPLKLCSVYKDQQLSTEVSLTVMWKLNLAAVCDPHRKVGTDMAQSEENNK